MSNQEMFFYFIFGFIALILFLDFIARIVYYICKKEPLPMSYDDVKVVIIILVVFFTGVILYLKREYDIYRNSIPQNINIPELALLDMQANTLAITAIVITLASLILTLLTFYKEKKAAKYDKVLSQGINKLKNAQNYIVELADISSVHFIDESYKDFYTGAISQHAKEQINNQDNILYTHSRIVLISNLLKKRTQNMTTSEDINTCDEIINYADQIIKKNPRDSLATRFAYMETLNALYQKIKINLSINPYSSQNDIKKAKKYLELVSRTVDDDFGYVNNLYGLVYLWSGMSKIRCGYKTEGEKLIEKALPCFDNAINLNKNNEKFINHKIVALCQLFTSTDLVKYYEEASKIYDNLALEKSEYYKIHLTYGSLLIEKAIKYMRLTKLSELPNYQEYEFMDDIDYWDAIDIVERAKKEIEKAIFYEKNFVNNHFKLCEAILIEMIIRKYFGEENKVDELCNAGKKELRFVEECEKTEIRGYMFVAHAFYKFIGEDAKAQILKQNIEKSKDTNL